MSNNNTSDNNNKLLLRKPQWLKVKLTDVEEYYYLKSKLTASNLHTICESANCPNQAECWKTHTATFLILGNACSRNCKFCNVTNAKTLPPDPEEPAHIASIIKQLNLKHVVITSVTRDDLPDGGANHWADVIYEIRKNCPLVTIETLIPDFQLNTNNLNIIIKAKPNIVSHNLETVRRITPLVRNRANYDTSLKVLEFLAENKMKTKTGIMVGLGETDDEIYETMDDIINTGCKIITIGQYLQPSIKHYPIHRFVTPDTFDLYQKVAIDKGFIFVESSPLVRSSYHADKYTG